MDRMSGGLALASQPAGFGNNPSAYFYNGSNGAQGSYGTPQQQQQPTSQGFQTPAYYNGSAGMASTAGGNMIHQQQQRHAGLQQSQQYSSAPFSPAHAPAQAPLPQQYSHLSRQSQSASPQQRLSPAHAQQQAPATKQQTPPNKYPMAAPPLPQTPAANAQQQSQPPAGSPQTPLSPGSQNREQARIALLLDINVELLQEVNRLQVEGKGGAVSPQQVLQFKAEGRPSDTASEEYIQVLRRVQANLAYLMPKAQNDLQKMPKGPAYMGPPPHMPQLQPKYDMLKELFPEWQGLEHRTSQSNSSPVPPNGGFSAANGNVMSAQA